MKKNNIKENDIITNIKCFKDFQPKISCMCILNNGDLLICQNDFFFSIIETTNFQIKFKYEIENDNNNKFIDCLQLKNEKVILGLFSFIFISSFSNNNTIFKIEQKIIFNELIRITEISNEEILSFNSNISIIYNKKNLNLYQSKIILSIFEKKKLDCVLDLPFINEICFSSCEGQYIFFVEKINYKKINNIKLRCLNLPYTLCSVNKKILVIGCFGKFVLIELKKHEIIKEIILDFIQISCTFQCFNGTFIICDRHYSNGVQRSGSLFQYKINENSNGLELITKRENIYNEGIKNICELKDGGLVSLFVNGIVKVWK